MKKLIVWCGALSLVGLSGCATLGKAPPPTVARVDLARYMGRWNIIANVPYALENGKVATYDSYALRPDGKIDNVFTFRKRSDGPEKQWKGIATVTNTTTNAEWSVRFIWPLTANYYVLALDDNYSWAIVADGSHRRLWILARDHFLPDETYASLVKRAAELGYDPTSIKKVPQ